MGHIFRDLRDQRRSRASPPSLLLRTPYYLPWYNTYTPIKILDLPYLGTCLRYRLGFHRHAKSTRGLQRHAALLGYYYLFCFCVCCGNSIFFVASSLLGNKCYLQCLGVTRVTKPLTPCLARFRLARKLNHGVSQSSLFAVVGKLGLLEHIEKMADAHPPRAACRLLPFLAVTGQGRPCMRLRQALLGCGCWRLGLA